MADEIEAGLYVLGVLEWEEMQEMAQRALREPALADAIAAWETKLAPLGVLAGSAEPPPDLWARIAASLRPTPASRAAPRPAGPPHEK